jgi:Cof subfamily protein (haloacid dehalogenase superfamily)
MQKVQDKNLRSRLPFRLAAIDIDDTLVGPDKVISDANRQAIDQLRSLGVRVVLASGRGHNNMLPFHRSLGLDGFIVSAQGALVKHADTNKVLYERSLGEAETLALVEEGAARELTVLCFGHQGVYAQRRDRWTEVYQQDSNAHDVHFVDLRHLPERNPLKVIWAGDPDRIDHLMTAAAIQYAGRLTTCITNPYYLEFNVPDAHKAAGVRAVADHYRIPREQVMAFGDGNNDVQMLSWAGLGVAMNGGRPSAKAAAKRVSPPGVPETALARAIEAILEESCAMQVA